MTGTDEMTLSVFETRFKNRKYIGSGGFAKVYKAFDHAKNHYVALKVADVRPEWKQFTLQREVELVNKLAPHPNIARYDACYRFDMGVAGEIDFAILKFYEEGNLEQFLASHELSAEDIRVIIKGILRGISFLHHNNYVHRDMKSQNILLQRDDGVWTPKITDFGLSRSLGTDSTTNNSAIGLSYAYSSPEQIQNRKIYKNVDLWAAGVIIYRIVAGELPFKNSKRDGDRDTQSQMELSRKIVNVELPEKLKTIEEPYQAIIRRCLIADPKLRCQTADELLTLLDGEKQGNFYEEEDEYGNRVSSQSRPTLFVPVEPANPPADAEKTQVMEPPPSIFEQPPVPPQPSFSPPPPPPSVRQPSYSSPPPEYATPKADYTQIIGDRNKNIPPPPPADFTPKSGEPGSQRKRVVLFSILILLLGVGGFALYWLANNEQAQGITPESDVMDYEQLRALNEAAVNDPEKLEEAAAKIELYLASTDYRRTYELAKNRIYGNNIPEAAGFMKEAVIVAIEKGNTRAFIQDIERDKTQLSPLVSHSDSKWEMLLRALKNQDVELANQF
ncbi:MAG: serine/threonine-protein kinase [Bacteroidota bacterium]